MKTINNHEPLPRFNPLNDFLFFKVMGEKGDEPQLLGFLNAVLGRSGKKPLESVEIKENKTFMKDIISGKSCILDVLAVLHDGTKVNIEVQLGNQYNMERRSLFYWSKVYYQSLNEGQNYRGLPNVIAVNIVGYDFPPGGNVHTRFNLREDSDPSLILSPALEIHFINMVQWRKLGEKDIAANPLHRWLTWFDEESPPELIAEVTSMDSAIRAAYEKFGFVTQQDFDVWDYNRRRQKAQWDLISNLDGARMEGEQNKAIEIARKMKTAGRPCSEIEEFTGLPSEIIAKL